MKKIITIIFFILFVNAVQAQNYEDLTKEEKHYVDSVSNLMKQIAQFRPHNKFISFTAFGIEGYENLWKYFIYDKYYKTKESSVTILFSPVSYTAKFYTFDDYNNIQNITVQAFHKKGSEKITEAKIIAPFKILVELYLNYFGAHPKDGLPPKGGLDKTYTPTDEVRIFSTYILITPHNNKFSSQ